VKDEKRKKKEKSDWKLPKMSPSNKKKTCRGAHHTIFDTGCLVSIYATAVCSKYSQ
jgi:hypothetical protein